MIHFLYLFRFSSSIIYRIRYYFSQFIKFILILIGRGIQSDYFFGKGKFIIGNKFGKFEIEEPSDMHAILSEAFEFDIQKYFICPKDKIFLDIGANIGKYSIFMSNQGVRTYSFEPNPITFSYLQRNKSLNGLSENLRLLPYGLGTMEESIDLFYPGSNYGLARPISMSDWVNPNKICINLKTYSSFLGDSMIDFQDIGLIKIDVEGSEYNVLLGMKNYLPQQKCSIIIEIVNDFSEINSLLISCGYKQVFCDGLCNYVFTNK